ncbi:hypothetical protein [Sporosarcina cyprini]|uniref:hypothetical protein n=1 Tax=Sporosarcina cyprini TaxID=2910523 RepID=UPI001EDD7A90|nr:hypothetical protein [Sporosarcina cyprini]MCG3089154.1 hypothetical protein [Sporosarcina cyprini]
MEAYKCEVERTDRYEIEFDENVCNEQWMEDFRSVFYDFYDLEEHARHIAQFRARFGSREIEGYGVPLENGQVPYWARGESYEGRVNYAINIKILSEDDDIYIDTDLIE